VYVWDLCRLHRRKGRPRNLEDGLVEETMDTIAKKRRLDLTMDHEPVLRIRVCDGVLYDIKFIESGSTKQQLLVTCGDNGIFLFQWSVILQRIPIAELNRSVNHRHNRRRKNYPADEVWDNLKPIRILHPHPTSTSPTEINRIAYDQSSNRLFGAAGDLYGGYAWDLDTGKFIGTLRGGGKLSRRTRTHHPRVCGGDVGGGGHSNYLHAIATVPTSDTSSSTRLLLTGGEDGKVGIWDSTKLEIRHMIDCKAELLRIAKNGGATSTAGNDTDADTIGTTASNNHLREQDSCWISSIDVDPLGHWAVIGGGIDRHPTTNNNHNTTIHQGFVASLHIPTHTINTTITTREIIQDVSYHPTEGKILTVGNEGVISYWNGCDLGKGRVGRAWLTLPSAYCTTVCDDGGAGDGRHVAIGGVGRTVDCISGMATRVSLTF